MPATVWKGYLSFGLVSFPVRLYAAARAEAVHFHMLHAKDESRIKEVWYCAEEQKPVKKAEIVKGYEYAKGKYVIVDEAELQKIAPPTATAIEILQFVQSKEIDPIFLEKSYYVAPEAAGSKACGLLRKAMADTGYCAVGKVAMHGREHIVIMRPVDEGLVLHTIYFVSELRKNNQAAGSKDGKYSAKEMELAKRLIDTLAGPFKPEQYEDEYRKNVERLINQKRQGRPLTAIKQPKRSAVVDLIGALKRSLDNAEKPAKVASAKKSIKRTHKAA